jgi:hypothetical protein
VAFCKTPGEKPDDVPASPPKVYADLWQGWGDWLGTGAVAPQKRRYSSFEEAREFVRALNLRGKADWETYCQSGQKPDDIPADPSYVYGRKWKRR